MSIVVIGVVEINLQPKSFCWSKSDASIGLYEHVADT